MHYAFGYLLLFTGGSVLLYLTNDPSETELFIDLVVWFVALVFAFCMNLFAALIASNLKAVRPIGVFKDSE